MQKLERILILSSEFPPGPGGIGTHAYQLAKHLSADGLKILVLTPQNYATENEIADFNRQQNFKITHLPSHQSMLIKWVKRLIAYIQSIRTFRPQLVIASGLRAIWLSALILRPLKIPYVIVGHGLEFGISNRLGAVVTRVTANRANGIICVSAYTQSVMEKSGVVKPPSFVIHNGADQSTFFKLPESAIEEFRDKERTNNTFILLTVGRVCDRKGQEVVIRALPYILKDKPETLYWMVGLPEIQAALEAIAKELGVIHAIQFWGKVENDHLRQLYNACDLFTMTSRPSVDGDFEGYGIAVIEAALCGKPALVSDNSGLAEAVRNDVTGIIVPQNDPIATAEGILHLIKSPGKIEMLGKQAYQNAQINQTWDQVVNRYREVIQMIYLDSVAGSN